MMKKLFRSIRDWFEPTNEEDSFSKNIHDNVKHMEERQDYLFYPEHRHTGFYDWHYVPTKHTKSCKELEHIEWQVKNDPDYIKKRFNYYCEDCGLLLKSYYDIDIHKYDGVCEERLKKYSSTTTYKNTIKVEKTYHY